MPTHLAFLRAINLGATRRFPKEAIRATVESLGFTDVETHINTGNVCLSTGKRSIPRIEAALEAAFLADRGFAVPTIVYGRAEFAGIAADAATLRHERPDADRHYVELLRAEPSAEVAVQIAAASSVGVDIVVRGRALHSFFSAGVPLGGANTAALTRLIGVSTNRNATVIRAVADRWC